jgi:spore maturation protein CgeB
MKILYVAHGHFWQSTWPYAFIDKYIVGSLQQGGHEVRVYNIFDHAQLIFPACRDYARQNKLSDAQLLAMLDDLAGAALPLEVVEFEPDLILHIVGRLGSRVLKALRKLKARTAIWFMDDPQEIDTTSQKALDYDLIYTVESACIEAYRNAGSGQVTFLPLGCFPPVQKKLAVEEKYRSDICFIGVPFPARVEFFDAAADFLKNYKVKIIGGGKNIGSAADPWLWKRKLKRLDVLEPFILDEVVFPEEAAKYYNGAKINLNIHRAAVDERFEHGNKQKIRPLAVSGRTFEIAGCAGFQLIDEVRADYARHFEVGKEIASFSDPADFKKKVEYYLAHDAEREQMAAAAQAKAYARHTYAARLETILKSC